MKEAIRFLALAWKTVTPATISNCWKHTGILPKLEDQELEVDPMQELHSLLNVPLLQTANCMAASHYLFIYEEVETEELPSDDDIVPMVQKEDDDDDDDSPIPTLMQAVHAAKVLQQYFDSKTDEESSWAIVDLQRKLEKIFEEMKSQTS